MEVRAEFGSKVQIDFYLKESDSFFTLHLQQPCKILILYKPKALIVISFHVILAIFIFSARLGTIEISWQNFVSALFDPNGQNLAASLVWNVRIPRFLMALLAGGSLSVAGQAIQILVRNPLADPYTMGSASGAALGVNLAMMGWLPAVFSGVFFIPIWGFAGAMAASVLVLVLISRQTQIQTVNLLLIGLSVSILANSLLSLLTYWAARQTEVRHLLFWTLGNLDKANWETLGVGALFAVVSMAIIWWLSPLWNLLLLGDDKARSIGVSVRNAKYMLLIVSSLLTASVVCFCGPIGFVGLVVPFWVRRLVPITRSGFWPLSFLAGGIFISLCDLVARVAIPPFGLPIGLVTSLVGIPFFLYLLRSSATKSSF